MSTRRKFLTDCGMLAGGVGFSYLSLRNHDHGDVNTKAGKSFGMKLRFKPYDLHLKHVFTLASGSRSITPVMLT